MSIPLRLYIPVRRWITISTVQPNLYVLSKLSGGVMPRIKPLNCQGTRPQYELELCLCVQAARPIHRQDS